MYREITAGQLAPRLGTIDEPFLLDVRDRHEVAEWAIRGSVNIPLAELGHRLAELPHGRELVVVCASGIRSARAAEVLHLAGWDVANLCGGMTAWGHMEIGPDRRSA